MIPAEGSSETNILDGVGYLFCGREVKAHIKRALSEGESLPKISLQLLTGYATLVMNDANLRALK
jgi:hypothetical protein